MLGELKPFRRPMWLEQSEERELGDEIPGYVVGNATGNRYWRVFKVIWLLLQVRWEALEGVFISLCSQSGGGGTRLEVRGTS